MPVSKLFLKLQCNEICSSCKFDNETNRSTAPIIDIIFKMTDISFQNSTYKIMCCIKNKRLQIYFFKIVETVGEPRVLNKFTA